MPAYAYKTTAVVLAASMSLAGCFNFDMDDEEYSPNKKPSLDSVLSMAPLAAGDMPTSGSATFVGVATGKAAFDGPGNPFVSQLEMTANFGTGKVGGTFSNIFDTEVSVQGGSLAIDGTITGAGLNAKAAGDVSFVDDGESRTAAVSIDMTGQFVGTGSNQPKGVRGTFSGGYTADSEEGIIKDGNFHALRTH